MGVHGGGPYLSVAIESILSQTMNDLELIVVDDASESATGDLLASYDDPRLRLQRNEENIGLTRSLNRALAVSHGRYIARQDADDRSLADRLERQVAYLESNPDIALCGTWVRFVDESGKFVTSGRPPCKPDELAKGLATENKLVHGTILGRRELFARLEGYREDFRYTQDYDLYLRAIAEDRLANLPKELYELRFHDGSITTKQQELQHAYAELARLLWLQRESSGSDDLEAGVPVEELLDRIRSERAAVDFWRYRAMYRRVAGDMKGHRRALLQVIRQEPANPNPYGQFLLSLAGKRTTSAVARTLGRFRGRSR